MTNLVKFNKKHYLDTYFSEINKIPAVKKVDGNKYKFKILLGGKGRGKSGLAFQNMLGLIKDGKKVIYMRNTLDEIKNMKPLLLEKVRGLYEEPDNHKGTCTDEAITCDGKVLITFVSTKNYNKISGNMEPYAMVFYDEFNQILKSDTAKMVDDFFNICQTIFRHNPGNIGACGNTKTANNILFNLLKIEPYLPSDLLNISAMKDYYLICTYKNELFKNGVGDDSTLEMMRHLNPRQYKTMMEGDTFDVSSELVLNKEPPDFNNFKELKGVGLMDTKMYGTYEDGNTGYLKPLDIPPSEATITQLTEEGYHCITFKKEWGLGASPCFLSAEEGITDLLETKLKEQQVFFADYYLYTYLTTVGTGRKVHLTIVLDH